MPQNYFAGFRGPNVAAIDESAYRNDLLANERNRIPQRNKAEDVAFRGNEQAVNQDRMGNARKIAADMFTAIADAPDPIGTGAMLVQSQAFHDIGANLGLPVDQFKPGPGDNPEQIRAAARSWAQAVGAQMGAAEGFTLSPGQTRFGASGQQLASVQAAPGAEGGFSLSPGQTRYNAAGQQVAAAAAEPNSEPLESVLDPTTGNPILVPRSQAANRQPYQKPTGGLSPRDATTARNKLTMIRLARQQVAEARQAFQPIKGTFSAGPGGAYVPTPAGQSFDAKVNTMRGTITGLKRVPGVGAMSDYETRLDQSMLPERGRYEATTEQQLNDLDTMLNYMEQGYGGMLEDAGGQPSQAAPNSGGWTIVEVK